VEKDKKKNYFMNLSPQRLTEEMENFQLLNDLILDVGSKENKYKGINIYLKRILSIKTSRLIKMPQNCLNHSIVSSWNFINSLIRKPYIGKKKILNIELSKEKPYTSSASL
jgi:hypothetical protein